MEGLIMTAENGAGMTNNNKHVLVSIPSVGGLKVVPLLQLCCRKLLCWHFFEKTYAFKSRDNIFTLRTGYVW